MAALFARVVAERGQLGELYPLLLHSPGIAAGMLELGNGVRKTPALDPQVRELVICRVGMLAKATYEVWRHREIAQEVGVEPAKLEDLGEWEQSLEFTELERSALAYADAMTCSIRVPADVFAGISDRLTTRETVELTVTIAYYNMISRILVALEIEHRDGGPR